ncbi:MAG: Hsp20/alpha crystallin family protein [Anaerolineaceae bacterium]|nr:Hsp20/alpha crystallin family protein [Anaerolineaceae bacterium]
MTLYLRNPELVAEARRRMMRKMIENSFNTERILTFPMEMKSTKDEYTLTGMLPGLSADEINIQFNNGLLTIEGEYQDIHDENSEYLFSELPVGKFSRSIEIEDPIVSDKIEASMKDGVLTIRIPKAEEAKPKSIKIIAK